MEFASPHVYLGGADEEVDEGILDAISSAGGLSAVGLVDGGGGGPSQQPAHRARASPSSSSKGSRSSEDDEAEEVMQQLELSSQIHVKNKKKKEKKEKKPGFFSRLFGKSSSSSSSSCASSAPPPLVQQQAAAADLLQYFSSASPDPPRQSLPKAALDVDCWLPPPAPPAPSAEAAHSAPGAAQNVRPKRATYRRAVDTNIVAIKFRNLAEQAQQTFHAQPALCQCGAAVSNLSKVTDHEGKQVRSEAEGEGAPPGGAEVAQQQAAASVSSSSSAAVSSSSSPAPNAAALDADLPPLETGQCLWLCEFCGHANVLEEFIPAQLPAHASADYVLEAVPTEADAQGAQETNEGEEQGLVVFLLDISGSMCVSAPVKGKVQLRGARAIDPALLAFDDVDRSGLGGNTTYVSRLQSVQASVDAQLRQLAERSPNARVMLVTFNGCVTLLGDASSQPLVIEGNKLTDQCELDRIGREFPLGEPISLARQRLSDALFALEETGSTALGPALVSSIALASRVRGSTLILCTDGLANVGLGSMSSDCGRSEEEIEEWYNAQGRAAKESGVTVNVVSIKGDECRLEFVGLVAAHSGGKVERVDPANIANNFANMLAEPVLATNVRLNFFLHRGLQFRNEDDVGASNAAAASLASQQPGNPLASYHGMLSRDVGNVWPDSESTLEYGLRDAGELQRWSHLATLPFQVQIFFTTLGGRKMLRVITQAQPVTLERAVAEKGVKLELLSAQIAQKSAALARAGKYKEARLNWASATPLLHRAAQTPAQRSIFQNYSSNIDEFDRTIAAQQRLQELQEEELEGGALECAPAAGFAAASSSAPRRMKKRAQLSDESYRVIHKTQQLNSAGLI